VRLASAALVAVALLLAGCGGEDDEGSDVASGTGDTFTTAPTSWDGPPEPSEDGTISVAGFNEYARTLPDERRVPRELAIEFLQIEEPYEIEVKNRQTVTSVTVLRSNLEDDSVRAVRYLLDFGRLPGGVASLAFARVDYQCQQGRGHQGFSPALCL
jgi:hypothetical protein